MRTSVKIMLIACGTLLITIPPAFEYKRMTLCANLLEKTEMRSVDLNFQISPIYSMGCFGFGALMVLTAIATGFSCKPIETSSHD